MRFGSEAFLALFVLALAAMLLVPLPTPLIDLLIVMNLAFSFLLLLTSLYLPNAVSLLTFPTLLLLSTLFRLALNVASSRLILSDGDAGRVIEAFGSLLVGSQIAVGIIIFIIITIVNFLVIARGSSRVSEVAARFALDALPGKQAMIDNDLRSGLISPAEATSRRDLLRKESQLYGAMDGSMKFVQGDAIAGFLIILANIGGGLTIALSNGVPLSEAFQTYTILTIGDGLVAQVPALLIAICAGIVVTRVSSDDSATLGEDVSTDLFSRPGVLVAAGLITSLLAFIPGVPTLPFIVVGLLIAFTAYRLKRSELTTALVRTSGLGVSGSSLPARYTALPPTNRESGMIQRSTSALELPAPDAGTSLSGRAGATGSIIVQLDRYALYGAFESQLPEFRERWNELAHAIDREFGVKLPGVTFVAEARVAQGSINVLFDGVPIAELLAPLDCEVVALEPSHARALGLDVTSEIEDPLSGKALSWISTDQISEVTEPFQRFTGVDIALRAGCAALLADPSSVITVSKTFHQLAELEQSDPGFFDASLDRRFINPARTTQVLVGLLSSGLFVGSIRQVVEELADYCATYARSELGPGDFDVDDIIRHVRKRRVRQLVHGLAASASGISNATDRTRSGVGTPVISAEFGSKSIAAAFIGDPDTINRWRSLFDGNRAGFLAETEHDGLLREVRQAIRSGQRTICLTCADETLAALGNPMRFLLRHAPLLSMQELTAASIEAVIFGKWSPNASAR